MRFSRQKIYFSFFSIGMVALFLVFVFGYLLGATKSSSFTGLQSIAEVNPFLPSGGDLFSEVKEILKKEYVHQPISDENLYYGSIEGLVASLGDPYSVFLEPKLAESFKEELTGSFDGIGAEIGMKDGFLVIIAPLPGSPAERAGLRPSDRILAIDGKDTANIALDQAVSAIRGKGGTKVTLTIFREKGTPLDLLIAREKIVIPSISFETKEENIEVISIAHFSEDATKSFTARANEILVNQPKGLILDLRNNPGGYLDAAVTIASHFIEEGPIVFEEFSDGKRQTYRSQGRPDLKDLRVIVLVNKGSASASEILAGALQDYKLATIVGEKTFGKGSVQQLRNFKDRSALKLTVAKWLTPNQRQIDGVGIEPDVLVPMTNEDYEQDRDPQMEKAITIIKNL